MTDWNTETKYRTRDGRIARFIGKSPDGIPVFAIKDCHNWNVETRWSCGSNRSSSGSESDDILPPRRGVWVAVDVESGEPSTWKNPQFEKPDGWLNGVTASGQRIEWRFFVEAEPQP